MDDENDPEQTGLLPTRPTTKNDLDPEPVTLNLTLDGDPEPDTTHLTPNDESEIAKVISEVSIVDSGNTEVGARDQLIIKLFCA